MGMILSHRLGLVFIKGRKVAGTSIEMALAACCGPDDIVTPISPVDELDRMRCGAHARNFAEDRRVEADYLAALVRTPREQLSQLHAPEGRYKNHMSLTRVIALQGDVTERFEIVCAERDPYAKILSWASWRLGRRARRTDDRLPFDSVALRDRARRAVECGEMKKVRNIDLYRHPNGTLPDRVLRYEQLDHDLRSLLADRIAEPPVLPHAKRGVLANTLDPRDFFSEAHIADINASFAEEFEAFGYPRL